MRRRYNLYRHFGQDGKLLYVGISISALARLAAHKESAWFNDIATVTFTRCRGRLDALRAERVAIRREMPTHNIMHLKTRCRRSISLAKTIHVPDRMRPAYGDLFEISTDVAQLLREVRPIMSAPNVLRWLAWKRPKSLKSNPNRAIRIYAKQTIEKFINGREK